MEPDQQPVFNGALLPRFLPPRLRLDTAVQRRPELPQVGPATDPSTSAASSSSAVTTTYSLSAVDVRQHDLDVSPSPSPDTTMEAIGDGASSLGEDLLHRPHRRHWIPDAIRRCGLRPQDPSSGAIHTGLLRPFDDSEMVENNHKSSTRFRASQSITRTDIHPHPQTSIPSRMSGRIAKGGYTSGSRRSRI